MRIVSWRVAMRAKVRRGRALLAAIAGLSCSDVSAPDPSHVITASVTGDAAAGLNAEGQFILGMNLQDEIARGQARALASAYWTDAYPFILGVMTEDRGAVVHAADLVPCNRSFYVASAYEVIPPAMPAFIRKALASQWLVGMCYHGVEEVVIAVSALATDAAIENGHLTKTGEGNFFPAGVPVGTEIPMAPEGIANGSAAVSARRVSKVPVLAMRSFPKAPTTAVWAIEIESAVEVVGLESHSRRQTNSFFAGALSGWNSANYAVGRDEPSRIDSVRFVDLETNVATIYEVVRRAGIPKIVELVSFGGR
jgi:hypothetical protein